MTPAIQNVRRAIAPRWAVLAALAWLALGGAVMLVSRHVGVHAELCVFKRLTGAPCLTCGTGRGALYLLSARPLAAWACNPLIFTLTPAWTAWTLARLVSPRSGNLSPPRRARRLAWIALAALAVANWAYVILIVG